MSEGGRKPVVLDGGSLTLGELVGLARDPRARVELDPAAMERVAAGRRQIEAIVERYRADYAAYRRGDRSRRPVQDYGVTTGFGEFKDIPVPPEELEALQRNLVLSHCVGVGDSPDAGDPANYFPAEVVRAVLVIRLNAFLKGHSGVRTELVETLRRMLHRGIVPRVPIRGSLGSSGDLCPLAHLFAVLLGEGRYDRVETPGEVRRRPRGERAAAEHLEADLGAPLPAPSYKEGLALLNGATFSTALLALAVADGEAAAGTADAAAALTLEAVCGCARAFDPRIHAARGHPGQIASAARLRALLEGSRLVDRAGAVQDPYSLRCAPVVHGAARDALAYARSVVEREVNAATDNPLFFPDAAGAGDETWDWRFETNWPERFDGKLRASFSAGNFHGEPIGQAADFLAVALAGLATISERRTQMLLDRHHNRNLPANLIARRGVHSGYMLAQYSAASLVTENKVLAHPASVDSIPTSANVEDHNAMAATAGRKLGTVLGNVQAALAIELLTAAQAVEWRVGMDYPPLSTAPGPSDLDDDTRRPARGREGWASAEEEAEEFRQAAAPEKRRDIAASLGRGTRSVYLAVREVAEPMLEDRVIEGDIRAVWGLVREGRIGRAGPPIG